MPGAPRSPETTLDLPELDKADDSGDVDVGVFELSMGEELSLDDEEDAVDPFEVDITQQSDPGSNEAASDLEVGMADLLDILPDEARAHENDEPAPNSSDLDLHLDAPLESDEPSTDAELGDDGLETLPELTNDTDDGDSGPELERPFLPGAPEGDIPPGPSLDAEWLLLSTPCSALWAGDGVVLAGAEKLMHFGDVRQSHALPLGARPSSLALLDTGNVILSTTRGLLEVSPSGACTFPEPPELRGSGSEIVELAGAPSEHNLWARLSNGVLMRRRGGAWERHEAGGTVRSLTSLARSVTLLVIAKKPTLQLSMDAGSSFRELLLPEPAATVALGSAPTAVSHGAILAIADAERGLCVSSDAGETFRLVTGAVNVTAIAIGEHAGRPALFAALHREGKDVSELIVVDPASGIASRIAELAGEPDEESEETGRTSALIFADGYLWSAGSYGLARLR